MAAGLFSPARIVHAGQEALQGVPGVGEKKAAAILEAAQSWIDEHPPAPPAEAPETEESAGFVEHEGSPDEQGLASESEAPPENAARAPAE